MTRPSFACALAAAALAGSAAIAVAQSPPPSVAPRLPAVALDVERLAREHAERAASFRWDMLADAGDFDLAIDTDEPSFAFIAREFGSIREIVKNAPYAAEAVNEVVQTFADGNRIVRRSATLVARDGYGRTRQEKKGGTVYLFDPMDNKSYALNPDRKTAVRIPRAPTLMPPPQPTAPPPPSAFAPPPIPPIPPVAGLTTPPTPPGVAPRTPSERVIVKRSAEGKEVEVTPGRVVVKRSTPDGKEIEDVRVEVVRVAGERHGMHETPLPALALPLLPRGKGETKSLGTREFEGVKADGTMTTHTIPAGEIGNERPIVITSERWFSPELHVVVYAKTSDPRNGDTVYRLTNLKRGEPPAELFRVPADYRVRR